METSEVRLDSIQKLMSDIWGSILGMEINPHPGVEENLGGTYTAWIRIIGSENITLILRCPEALALEVTAAMFASKPGEVDAEQVKDSLKEIVNMLAGNVKGMMTKYHFLSMPSICEPDKEPRFPSGDVLAEFGFKSQDQPLKLTLLKVD